MQSIGLYPHSNITRQLVCTHYNTVKIFIRKYSFSCHTDTKIQLSNKKRQRFATFQESSPSN